MLLYVGRFTDVKRLGLLIEAHAARARAHRAAGAARAPGRLPGRVGGRAPAGGDRAPGARDVFLAGWHAHDELPGVPQRLRRVVLPSVREQFGQVLVEAMACGLPPDRRRRLGPADIVADGRRAGWWSPTTSWRSPMRSSTPSTARASAAVVAGAPSRRNERYAWPALAEDVAATYEAARSTADSGLLGAGA